MRYAMTLPVLCALACADEPTVALEPIEHTTVRFRIPAQPEGAMCYRLDIRGYDSTWYSSTLHPWLSFGAALDAGTLCSDRNFEHVVGCRIGKNTAELWAVLYDGDAPDNDYYVRPLSQSFSCTAGEETVVAFAPMQIFEVEEFGFLDLQVYLGSVARLDNTCFSARIEAGEDIVVAEYPGLCTDTYGSPTALNYFLPCYAEAQPARVRLVIDDFEFAQDVPPADRKIVNPCPPGGPSHRYWEGACVKEIECRANEDVLLTFDLELAAPGIEYYR